MAFVSDLAYGQAGEKALMDKLLALYGGDFSIGEKTKEYDFVHVTDAGDKVFYEVKRDRMAPRTGNIAIEFRSRGKESGISTTVANYICYIIEDKFWIISPSELIKLIGKDKRGKFTTGGDNNSSLLYLLKLEDFYSHAKEVT